MAKVKSATQKRRATARKVATKANPPAVTGEQLRAQQMERKYAAKAAKAAAPVKAKKIIYSPDEILLAYALTVSGLNVYKVNLGFLRLSRPDFFEFIGNVFSMMNGNSHYPTPSPTIAAIQTEIGLYNAAKALKQTTAANQHLANIKYMMKQLGIYVANTCTNDLPILQSSGFIANKLKPGPSKLIGKGVIRDVKKTNHSGECIAIVDAVPGANFYKGSWCLADVLPVVMHYTRGGAGVKVKFKSLPINVNINLYVTASGPLEDGDPSDPKPYSAR